MLEAVGAVVESNDENGHKLSLKANMKQLAFIKKLDSIKRVSSHEGSNPFLSEVANAQTAPRSVDGNMTADATVMSMNADDGIVVASVTDECCTPPTIPDGMASAREINVDSPVTSQITCPGAEQWFKVTIPKGGYYTIYTTGSLDTVGALYTATGVLLKEVDDYEPAGKTNFRIYRHLLVDQTYYIKVSVNHNATGSYVLRVVEKELVDSVQITGANENGVIVLDKGKTYEMPMGEGYTFQVADGETILQAPFGVSISPVNADNKDVYWTFSSPSGIGSVQFDNNCPEGYQSFQKLVTTGTGVAYLYAHDWNDMGRPDMKYVVVKEPNQDLVMAYEVNLDQTELKLMPGQTQTLVATILPDNATAKNVSWESSNPEVATVSTSGRVTAIAPGEVGIYARAMDGSACYARCGVRVGGGPVTGVELDTPRKTITINKHEDLHEQIIPDDARNQNVSWSTSNSRVASVDPFGTVTANAKGNAIITVKTEEGNYTAECTVTVDPRPKVVIEKDTDYSYGNKDYFNIIFPDGKIWRNIGIDLSKRSDNYETSYIPVFDREKYDDLIDEEQRYLDNILNSFSVEQIAYIYLLDPLGIEFYMKRDACNGKTLYSALTFKDNVYEAIFGTSERMNKRFYFTVEDNNPVYGAYENTERVEVFSNAEVLFGFHNDIDWNWSVFLKTLLEGLFDMAMEAFKLDTVVAAYQLLFHAGSIMGTCSSGAVGYMNQTYEDNIEAALKEKYEEKYGEEYAKTYAERAKLTIHWVHTLLKVLVDAALESVEIPNPQHITIYNKIKAQTNYVTELKGFKESTSSIEDIINQVSE